MRAYDIPDALHDLRSRCKEVQFQRLLGISLMEQFSNEADPDVRVHDAVEMFDGLWRAARHAECFHVTEDMNALVMHAAESLDETDAVDFSQSPSPYGIVNFDGKGITIQEARGRTMQINWIAWSPMNFATILADAHPIADTAVVDADLRSGYVAFEFNDAIDNPDEFERQVLSDGKMRQVRKVYGRWAIIGAQIAQNGLALGPTMLQPGEEQSARILLEGDTPSRGTNTLRILHALWLLMSQSVTEVRKERPPAPVRKEMKARGIKAPEVTVIELRRRVREGAADAADRGESSREYTCQWIVRGFWRWQRYGEGNKERKRIWIEPYVKGPADKPLRVTTHVYDVRR